MQKKNFTICCFESREQSNSRFAFSIVPMRLLQLPSIFLCEMSTFRLPFYLFAWCFLLFSTLFARHRRRAPSDSHSFAHSYNLLTHFPILPSCFRRNHSIYARYRNKNLILAFTFNGHIHLDGYSACPSTATESSSAGADDTINGTGQTNEIMGHHEGCQWPNALQVRSDIQLLVLFSPFLSFVALYLVIVYCLLSGTKSPSSIVVFLPGARIACFFYSLHVSVWMLGRCWGGDWCTK